VDDELAPQDRRAVERLIHDSPEVARHVAKMRAARNAARIALARQDLPPVPDSLTQRIGALAESARAGGARSSSGFQGLGRTARQSMLRPAMAWLIGAFAAGAVCAGLVLQVWPALGLSPGTPAAQPGAVAKAALPWVQQVVNYVALYTRGTLEYEGDSPQTTSRIVADIQREDGMAIRVPDLTSAGLAFKGIQRLSFNGRPLVQIMYLPEQGDPVALCIIKDPKPDQALDDQQVTGRRVVTWRQAELGYALIGAPSEGGLRGIAQSIAERRVDALPLARS
jgi:anti-sigma factor RsiW